MLGPNGAGKTTLLRALAGLIALTDGQHHAERRSRSTTPADDVFLPAEERPIGLVFQNYRLFPHLSRARQRRLRARVAGAAPRGAARSAPTTGSTGSGSPSSPTASPASSPAGRPSGSRWPARWPPSPGCCCSTSRWRRSTRAPGWRCAPSCAATSTDFAGPTLLVTHDPLEAMVMTDRLLVIEDGRIVQEGSPAEVARRPATQYVARLVGLNLYAGHAHDARRDRARRRRHARSSRSDAPSGARDGCSSRCARTRSRCTPARPEHSSPRNVWPGTIAGLELLIDRVRVQVDGTPPALVDITPDAVAELDLTAGAPVWLSAKATDIDTYPEPG